MSRIVDLRIILAEIIKFFQSSASTINLSVKLLAPINENYILTINKKPSLQETASTAIATLISYIENLHKVTIHTEDGDVYKFVRSADERQAFINAVTSAEYNKYLSKLP